MIGGEPGRYVGTLGNGAVAGDEDIEVAGGLTQPVECRLIGAHLIGAARVEERDQHVGEQGLRPLLAATGSQPRLEPGDNQVDGLVQPAITH